MVEEQDFRYGLWEIIATIVISVFIVVNGLLFVISGIQSSWSSRLIFSFVLWEAFWVMCLFVPYLIYKFDPEKERSLKAFLRLSSDDQQWSYPRLVSFLGEMTLAAFVGSFLVSFGIQQLCDASDVKAVLLSLALFILIIAMVFLAACSLVRFVWIFIHKTKSYYIASLSSITVAIAFIHFGLQAGAKPC